MKIISKLSGTITETAEIVPIARLGMPIANALMTMDGQNICVSNGKVAVRIPFSELETLILTAEPALKS